MRRAIATRYFRYCWRLMVQSAAQVGIHISQVIAGEKFLMDCDDSGLTGS